MALQGLAGKVVVVTGGASGIGRASVERLLEEGARVVLVDHDAERVAQALSELRDREVAGAVADVSTEGGTEAYFAAARERFGRVDGLHANAGIEGPVGSIAEIDMADYDRLMAVNLRGVFLGIRQMLRTLAQQGGGGAIVCTASALGLRGRPGLAPYAASKAGVISLVKTAAMEAGPSGVRVNAVLPGPTDTSMIHRLVEESGDPAGARAALHAGIPLGRYGRPQEIAALAAWLLSDESSFVNGGIYTVDGGESAG
jgi:NAD(P)-dependent dehydrogenase (short-subunit alcohol dehydrogenase family)